MSPPGRDLTPALEEATLTEARQLAQTLTNDSGSLLAMYLLGCLHWFCYQALPEGHGQEDLQATVIMFTACFINGMGGWADGDVAEGGRDPLDDPSPRRRACSRTVPGRGARLRTV